MRAILPLLAVCLATTTLAEDVANHRFDPQGAHQQDGFPEHAPKILVVAEKPVTLHFSNPAIPSTVEVHRITSARKVQLDAPAAESTANNWTWTWTPPKTRGPAHYEVILHSEPKRVVLVESRDPTWLKTTRDMLTNADWHAEGITREELSALSDLGLNIRKNQTDNKSAEASLQMLPKQGDASRRRIVWDKDHPSLVVWRPGPATGDLEVRAPRWWISPAALATDHGLIRFLDLFSEPPLQP